MTTKTKADKLGKDAGITAALILGGLVGVVGVLVVYGPTIVNFMKHLF